MVCQAFTVLDINLGSSSKLLKGLFSEGKELFY